MNLLNNFIHSSHNVVRNTMEIKEYQRVYILVSFQLWNERALYLGFNPVYILLVVNRVRVVVEHPRATSVHNLNNNTFSLSLSHRHSLLSLLHIGIDVKTRRHKKEYIPYYQRDSAPYKSGGIRV